MRTKEVFLLQLIISVINVCLHSAGLYLIVGLRRCDMSTSQKVFLFNLSLSELVATSFIIAQLVFEKTKSIQPQHNAYIEVANMAGFALYYYVMMLYLTMDRFFEVYLNIKYPLYWSGHKSTCLCIATFVACIVLSVIITLLWHFQNDDVVTRFHRYVYPIIDTTYLVVAATTYVYLFVRFRASRRGIRTGVELKHLCRRMQQQGCQIPKPDTTQASGEVHVHMQEKRPPKARLLYTLSGQEVSGFKLFLRSQFLVVTMIAVTFIVLVVIPDIVMMFVVEQHHAYHQIWSVLQVMYSLAFTTDAVIYIFLHRKIRELLIRKITGWLLNLGCR